MLIRFLLPILLTAFDINVAQAQGRQCGQVDQLQQTRCQIENAILSRNYSLLDTILQKSIYANANDVEVCGNHTYAQCVAATGELQGLEVLFKHGLDANLRFLSGTFPILAMLLDNPNNSTQKYGEDLISIFRNNHVELSVSFNARDGRTLRYFILSKCKQDFNRLPRYRGAIETLIIREFDHTEIIDDLDNIIDEIKAGTVNVSWPEKQCSELRTRAASPGGVVPSPPPREMDPGLGPG